MERRGFLKSLVGGITSAGLLLKATPAEVRAFGVKTGAPVILGAAEIAAPVSTGPWFDGIPRPGEALYNAQGKAVAVVESVDMGYDEPLDVTTFSDTSLRYVPSTRAPYIDIQARGIIDWR